MNFKKLATSGVILGAVMLSALASAQAQDISDSHLAAARSAISAIEATDRYDDILPNIALGIKQQLIANNPDLEAEINDVVDGETIALVSRRGDLENEAASAYAKALSEEHLTAISEFYNSEPGKALLANGAIISREVQQAAGIWQRGVERDLLENVNAKLREVAPRVINEENAEGTEEAPANN